MTPFASRANILLVDDRPDGLLTLEAVLSGCEYHLVKATSGQEALTQLLERDFAVIILDVQMPGMDGFELAKLIKGRERNRDVPIIFVTAINKDPRFVYQGYQTGAVDYLFKPFDAHTLQSKVAVFVDLYQKTKLLEEQTQLLKSSEDRLRLMIESARDIISTVSPDGTILSLSPSFEAITGWPISDWIGKPFDAIVHPDDLQNAWDRFREMLKTEGPLGEVRVRTRTGAYVTLETSGKPLIQEGRLIGVLSIARDVSQRKQIEEEKRRSLELERSNRELEHFAMICSHDLQEPLRIIATFSQLLSLEYGGTFDGSGSQWLEYIVDSAKRMSALIRDILDYSRLGDPGVCMENIQFDWAFDESLKNLQTSIAESGAQVTRGALPVIAAVPSHALQLLQNLISNAIKFRSERALKIHVSAEKHESEWLFAVADNGIGMDAPNRDRIFDIFGRLHGRDQYPGTGMGLAICKKIVERYGGRIWVESVKDVGSTFFFSLPDNRLAIRESLSA